jgi:hypothetical protein
MDVPTFTVGSWRRLAVGMALAITAGLLIALGRGLGNHASGDSSWGLSWICYIPAAVLMLPAMSLVRRTRLVAEVDSFTLEMGWLFRRGWTFRLANATLEFVPTMGLWTVVMHRNGNKIVLANWIGRKRADELAGWLAAVAGQPLPMVETAAPAGDR